MEYSVTFSSPWGEKKWPVHAPVDSHTGNMILVTHNSHYDMFVVGENATDGVIESAEFGTLNGLLKELKQARVRKAIDKIVTGDVITTPGSVTWQVTVNESHPLLSFQTMVAPSPDWFTGVSSLSLQTARKRWRKKIHVPLFALDAGSDKGRTFRTLPKHPRRRRVPISLIQGPPFFARGTTPRRPEWPRTPRRPEWPRTPESLAVPVAFLDITQRATSGREQKSKTKQVK